MFDRLNRTIEELVIKNSLDDYRVEQALITAPFGQKHFDEGVAGLTESKAICELAEKGEILVLVITACNTVIGDFPSWLKVIQIDKIPNWPTENIYQNRFIKWAIPFLFKNIKMSIYLDSDIIITSQIRKLLHVYDLIEQHKFLVTAHVMRRGWVDEINAISNWSDKIDLSKLERQKKLFQFMNIPKLGPVFMNKFVGRTHGSRYDILSQEVLNHLFEYSSRDQLALIYAMHKNKIIPFSIPEGEIIFTRHVLSLNEDTVCFYDRISKIVFEHICKKLAQKW